MLAINDKVISLHFGIGVVTAIEKVGDPATPFFVIEAIEGNFKTLVPVKLQKGLRKLSSREQLEQSLLILKNKPQDREFPSKKDRIAYFKDHTHNEDLNELVSTIHELHAIRNKGSVESKLFSDLLSFFAKEMAFVTDTSEQEALKKIQHSLKTEL